MSRFVFKLQRVLDMRLQAVDEAQAYLENCRKVVAELRRLLLEQRDEYVSERDQMNEALRNGEYYKHSTFEQSLESRKAKMLELLQAIKVAEQDVDIAEQHLIACRRNLKVMENFRDKKALEFAQQEEIKERKFLDEQATLRHQRAIFDSSR
ncbi:MAG: Flagellar FliJ protein [Pseudomonadota bacterium]|jgi:flagellar FliJ protein